MPRIPTRDLMHGAALLQLVPENGKLLIEAACGGFILNDGKMSTYLKITTKQGKAQFNFTVDNIREMMDVQRQSDIFYLGLIAPADGVCALTWDEFATLISVGDGITKTLSMKRAHGGRFRITGSDSEKELTIPANRWQPNLVPL